ncbi:MAG TPA: NADH-quinone oxidoreductase subunit L [Acidimicrobiales bacterium]|nr:NADH-quinone oxidoreductase subunit L [Acidimicrobiales bacterium]HLN43086.1 NADH-quinone oxidoreductase subunit L [Acidimicrobiales bacterium]
MLHAAYLMPLLPLAGFVVLAALGRRLGDPWAGWLGTATVAGSFVVACVVYAGLLAKAVPQRSFVQTLFTWIPVGGLQVKSALLIDPLSMTMALFVTGVSSLIHLYSIGYMKGDRDYPKFFLYLNLFVASMLLLVLADNLLFTFVGWEGVGVCSYWLVAFWFGRDSAASAGKKAFIYNRLADVGFLIAIFLVFSKTGTLDYKGIFSHLSLIGGGTGTAICLLLFVAAAGKSAQLPLFPWLADAMEGPTPVSALIHAATMVTAGVYLMCRISPLLAHAHDAQLVVASIGAVTAFVAATIGCAQQDIKKVLAYSTVSQLGYMFLAVGLGAYEAAIFLMVAHAFFKALLFLGAGSVIHGLHDEQDLKRMGNLRRYMKLTFFTFGIGTLAIAGIPPLSGFFAKGDILDNAFARYPVLWAIGLVTAALTAYYMTRLVALAFYGDDRWRDASGGASGGHNGGAEPHEGPWVMALPLVVLAVLAFFGGVLHLPWHPSWNPLGWLGPVFGSALYEAHQSSGTQWALGIVDAVIALVGLGVAFSLWSRRAERPGLEPVVLQRAYFLDDVYDAVIGRPGQAFAQFCATVIEAKVIDGAVNGVGRLTRAAGGSLRRVQTGFVRQYALGIVLGAVVLLAWMLSRAVS